jgi:glycosyltransferase involved in cell wall biosynthesis
MLGARMHYAVPRLLHEAGLLEFFYTDSYVGNKPWLERALKSIPSSLRPNDLRRWLGRKDEAIPPGKVISFEQLGLWYAYARRRARGRVGVERVFEKVAVRFSEHIKTAGLHGSNVLWGFDGASLQLFQEAKARGIRCILEQTILPHRLTHRFLQEEEERWPGWYLHREDPSSKAISALKVAREEREWELADAIVAGSEFVRSGLVELGVSEEKINVVPYGVDPLRFPAQSVRHHVTEGMPLRVLFAGEVGLRKGVPDLLHAFSLLPAGAVELRLAGRIVLAADKLQPWLDRVSLLGPVPRQDMRELYQWADVFVLPSIVEGSATVTYEALMSGLPVIATPNAGSIVRDGVDGFVVPIRDCEALARAIIRYHEDRTVLAQHQAATEESRRIAGLDRYRSDLVKLVRGLSKVENVDCESSGGR